MEAFVACFAEVADPRQDNVRHDLHEVLIIALCTMLCGGEDCSDMALFGEAKEPFLRQFLRLRHGIPSHDTFSRLFRRLDPAPFQACFVRFMERFAASLLGVVAIDGKTLRRSFDRASGKSPLHMVHAWAADQRLLLGQIAVDDKSNEIIAVPKLLAMLSLKGCIVTADALNCQRTIAAKVTEQGGDYVLALKGNQGSLHDDVRTFLDDPARPAEARHTTVDGEHGRIETRISEVSADIAWLQERHAWPGLAAIGKMIRTRQIGSKSATETSYYLLSTPLSAERFAQVARAHWGVENGLHWVLDVTMNEDQARHCKDHGPENIALLRRLALNLAKLEGSKGSIKAKLKRAGWDDAYLRDGHVSNGWLYLGSGNLSRRGFLTHGAMPEGNVETGVVFADDERRDGEALERSLFWSKQADAIDDNDWTVGQVGDAPEAQPILKAPPILSAMIAQTPTRRLRLHWRKDASAESGVSIAWTGRDWFHVQRAADVPLGDDENPTALYVRGESDRKWVVPVVDAAGRVGWQPPRFDAYADALAALLDFPIRPAEATDDGDGDEGDGRDTKGASTEDTAEQEKNYALHAAAEFVEQVAALQAALPESMLDDWLDHLDRMLRASFPETLIATWRTHRLDVFAHLREPELRSPHLTEKQRARYFEVLDGAARAWGLR